jgi:predicted RNA binding protein YcfA (HicA-like mRNA interferase family)
MTYQVLTRKLRRMGCEFVRQGPGSHEIWWNPANRHFTTIPCHRGKDIPKGTLAAILRDLGFTTEDLANK